MAVDSNFSSLLQNLKLDEPWLPSKPWESISSESGVSSSYNSCSTPSTTPLYHPSTVSEINLVRLVINALQGVESTLLSIEKLSESFCTEAADRTYHRIPSLWYRTSSTNALGKILKSIGRSGFVVFLLQKFVDYFLDTSLIKDENSGSLVNQAFAVAVKKVLEGFICSLDTLYASVKLRRSPNEVDKSANGFSGVGCLTSVVHSEITFLEVYLHTKELRTQIEAVGNICSFEKVSLAFSAVSFDELTADATSGFRNFPRGANLLSYLYAQLRDADPVHCTLIEFLFIRSCEPYCGFIKSWIYHARITDPYKEFIVEYSPYSYNGAGFSNGIWFSSVKLRDGVSVPCFMERFCLPLLRAGQQLQVLIKLLELCYNVHPGGQRYEDILPYCVGSSSDYLSCVSPLTFSKRKIEEMVLTRECMYKTMQEKLQILFTRFENKYQPINCSVMPFGTLCNTEDVNAPLLFKSHENKVIPSTADEQDSNSETYAHDSDNSSEMDEFESFEYSCDSFGLKNESNDPNEKHGMIEELRYLSANGLLINLSIEDVSTNPSENLHPRMKPTQHFGQSHEESRLRDISEHIGTGGSACSRFSDAIYADYQSVTCWPLGGLSENPFCDLEGKSGENSLHLINFCSKGPDRKNEVLKVEIPFCRNIHELDNSVTLQARGLRQLATQTHAPSQPLISPSWNLKYNSNVFNMNPMLTKDTWCHMINNSRAASYVGYKQPSLLSFDFLSVQDPCKVYGERPLVRPDDIFKDERCLSTNSSFSVTMGVVERFVEQGHKSDDTTIGQSNSSAPMFENLQEEDCLASVSGGAGWESSLNYLRKSIEHRDGSQRRSSRTAIHMPLDVSIDKCILQEILLQYTYVSNLTIKLLEDGFDLRGHLIALRRYHFMEFADWADLFIMSLQRHKWLVTEASQRISEIQEFLEMAVQRSSCEGDPYRERLFVHTKVGGMMPPSLAATGVHAFDYVALGYKVDWPISIIITPSALKIYADIFSFLIQVKLAVFSLTDVWRTLKDLVQLLGQNSISKLDERDRTYFNIITRMRHQVSHFVTTLQQYVQSQLSHVSWCRLLYSLKHQVRDMLDLESVHMAYLVDSLHICFLSDETSSVARIIESVLQCAMDFRSCFTGCSWDIGFDKRGSANIFAQLNIPQVLTLKATFEKNLKELYHCYLRSPKHGEFSICRFWEYLNYNDYYSSFLTSEVVHYIY